MSDNLFETVKVAIRFSPIPEADIKNGGKSILEKYVDSNKTLGKNRIGVISRHPETGQVRFHESDSVFPESSPTSEIYDGFCKQIVNKVSKGFNCCLLSYGPSKTGKRDLFFGTQKRRKRPTAGLVHHCVRDLFKKLKADGGKHRFEVIFSFWEMNDDVIIDLLKPSKKKFRIFRSSRSNEKIIKDLTQINIDEYEQFERLVMHGLVVGDDLARRRSGIQWHKFIKLTVIKESIKTKAKEEVKEEEEEEGEGESEVKSEKESERFPSKQIKNSFVFVNLRGTNRFGEGGARGEILREGGRINRSITSFQKMIHDCVSYCEKRFQPKKKRKLDYVSDDDNESEDQIIKKLPRELHSIFSDSKFTTILSDFFGSNCYSYFMCSVNTSEFQYKETVVALDNMIESRFIPLFPRVCYLKTEESELFKQIQKLEKKMPVDKLARGHPPTEMQEKLLEMKERLELLMAGEFTEEMVSQNNVRGALEKTRKNHKPIKMPDDEKERVWKANEIKSRKHGDRKVFFMPRKKKIKKFKEDWGKKNLSRGLKNAPKKKKHKYSYRGQWRNNMKEGFGRMETKHYIYEGEWKYNKKHGKLGIMWTKKKVKFDDSEQVYKGEWKKDKMDGLGVYYYENGDMYYGKWKNGNRHGKGTMYKIDGSKYIGNYEFDKKNGFGELIMENLDRYRGHFKEGKKHGPGVFFYTSEGKVYKGEWSEGSPKCGEVHYSKDMKEETEENDDKEKVLNFPKSKLKDSEKIIEKEIVNTRLKEMMDIGEKDIFRYDKEIDYLDKELHMKW